VNKVEEIDLDRHGFIEASAGTGKTYTIEHLVLRLLKEREALQLEEILLVTYTEKAAGELKARIRLKIETALAKEALTQAQSQKLGAALDGFDAAAIHTIHGFCHGVLSDYAFENGMPLASEVVDEAPIYTDQLREIMRRHWPARYGKDLYLLLRLAGFAGREEAFSATITAIAANRYRPNLGDRLLPRPSTASIGELLSGARGRLRALLGLLRPVDEFISGYEGLNFNAAARRSRLAKIIRPLAALAGENETEGADLLQFADWLQAVGKVDSQKQRGLDAIIPVIWNKSGANLEVCPKLESVVAHLRPLAADMQELKYRLQIEAIDALQEQVPRIKAQKGWISYNDMLTRVAAALTGPGGARLCAILRRRFKVAFVDEFQDTDPVQWQIFERLFLEVTPPDAGTGQLFLIGDPKQAIYAFRGADVFAYLTARQRMEALAARGQAGLYCLATNWRSSAELVTAFNRLFGQPLWFPPMEESGPLEIGHQSVRAPSAAMIRVPVTVDTSGRGAMNLIDLRAAESPKLAKYRLPALIAAEIQHLVTGSRIEFGDADPRRLGFGDICILIRGRSEAPLLERELRRRRIPYAFYKKPGLFQSPEAQTLSRVLHAIADPQSRGSLNAALLTPFFDQAPVNLGDAGGLPDGHPIRQHLLNWLELATQGRWSPLFDDLFSASGVLYRQACDPQWDRIESNYSQLRTYLQRAVYEDNLDLRGLTALLDTHIQATRPAEADADLHQIDTEAPKVQLMTMHVSKGLQFPVVFVAGGLTQPGAGGMTIYHQRSDGGHGPRITKVIDLTGEGGQAAHADERLAEDKRLLYVALTRAQLKLYLPFYVHEQNQPWVGPLCRILAPAVTAQLSGEGEGGAGAEADGVVWLTPAAILADGAADAPTQTVNGLEPGQGALAVSFPAQPNFSRRRPPVASFTRLHRLAAGAHSTETEAVSLFETASGRILGGGDGGKGGSDEASSAIETSTAVFEGSPAPEQPHPADRLPGGVHMGSLCHDILETIDFGAVRRAATAADIDADCQRLILRQMARYPVDAAWAPDLAELVWNTLNTPIPNDAGPLILGELSKASRLHEVEFTCCLDLGAKRLQGSDEGYLRGFIDLLFVHQGRYYILDWKSNRLDAGYGGESLAAGMDAAGYHLQYRIYTLVALRWLALRLGPDFNPRAHFGGVYYIYLRGMGHAPGSGVFFAPPASIGAVEALEADLTLQLEGCHVC
jgi:exodeoxyribonuclease V beta subunit